MWYSSLGAAHSDILFAAQEAIAGGRKISNQLPNYVRDGRGAKSLTVMRQMAGLPNCEDIGGLR